MAFFSATKNHKPPTFTRKIRGLCLQNVAVKKRLETPRERILETSPTAYKGCSLVACVEVGPQVKRTGLQNMATLVSGARKKAPAPGLDMGAS